MHELRQIAASRVPDKLVQYYLAGPPVRPDVKQTSGNNYAKVAL